MKRAMKLVAVTVAVALVVLLRTTPGAAVPGSEVLRVLTTATQVGNCCFSWAETVHVSEGTSPVPVVVTWNTDAANSGRMIAGIMVNGGPCITPGAGQIPAGPLSGSGYQNLTFQWILFASDGLVPGSNSITLCGGAHSSNPGGGISLGFNTLAVRKGA
jgi:hypothetical protein